MKLLALGFFGFGVLWLGVATLVAYDTLLIGERAEAQGVIADVHVRRGEEGPSYAPVVRFRAPSGDTVTFVSGMRTSRPRGEAGDAVGVVYDPTQPARAEVAGAAVWGGVAVFAGFGVLFGGIGAAFAVVAVRRRLLEAELRRSGRSVEGRLVEVVRDRSQSRNGRSPYRLVVQWQDPVTGRVWSFESPAVWYDPSSYVEPGQAVPVLVDPADPGRHLVDVSGLPEAGR